MKKRFPKILLLIGISILFVQNVNGQKPADWFKKNQLWIAIKDVNCEPIGYSKDSFVITNNSNLNNIFFIFKVKQLEKLFPNELHYNLLDSTFDLLCECNEAILMDTLIKFNTSNYNKLFYYVEQIPDSIILSMDKLKTSEKIEIYPNPFNNFLTINYKSNTSYNIEVYNSFGQLLFIADKNYNIHSMNMTDKAAGIYFIKIYSSEYTFFFKVIKN